MTKGVNVFLCYMSQEQKKVVYTLKPKTAYKQEIRGIDICCEYTISIFPDYPLKQLTTTASFSHC